MRTAFIVDDDATYLKFMQVHLRRFGYEVRSFIDGHGCLLHLHEKPQLIILDQNLEEERNGLDYLREIKSLAPDIPVLFLSAQNDVNAAVEALKLGAMDFIEKNSASYVRLRTSLERIEEQAAAAKKKLSFKSFFWFVAGAMSILGLVSLMFLLRA